MQPDPYKYFFKPILKIIDTVLFLPVVFATGARDGNVMVWDMRCNRRSGHFYQPVNIISNAHVDRLPGTPQTTKKKARRSSTPRPVMVSTKMSIQ